MILHICDGFLKAILLNLWVVFILIPHHSCKATHIQSLDDLQYLDFEKGGVHVETPLSLLANTYSVLPVGTYQYEEYTLKIIGKQNPEELSLLITKNSPKKPVIEKELQEMLIWWSKAAPDKWRLIWWSKAAPDKWRHLDYSKVMGEAPIYELGDGYRLKLLFQQGYWGKVYGLEQLSQGKEPTILCAVKLIHTRSDRNLSLETFHKRHQREIFSNLIVVDWDIAIQPHGIIKLDDDHYLLFLEYGQDAFESISNLPLTGLALKQIYDFINDLHALHHSGWTHGDIKFANMLLTQNKIKLCDWLSLRSFHQNTVEEYRSGGGYLSPEAIRAFYFGKSDKELAYSIINDQQKTKIYLLHPVASDLFSLGFSIMQIIDPERYRKFRRLMPKDFNPYKPDSLDFWAKYKSYLRKTQEALRTRARKIKGKQERQLFMLVAEFIDIDPMKRGISFEESGRSSGRFNKKISSTFS